MGFIRFSQSPDGSVQSNAWLEVHGGPFSTAQTAFASVDQSAYRAMHGAIIFSVDPGPEQNANKCRKVMQEAFWTDTSFSDCTIKCGTRVFKCHRIVLGTASPVWST